MLASPSTLRRPAPTVTAEFRYNETEAFAHKQLCPLAAALADKLAQAINDGKPSASW